MRGGAQCVSGNCNLLGENLTGIDEGAGRRVDVHLRAVLVNDAEDNPVREPEVQVSKSFPCTHRNHISQAPASQHSVTASYG